MGAGIRQLRLQLLNVEISLLNVIDGLLLEVAVVLDLLKHLLGLSELTLEGLGFLVFLLKQAANLHCIDLDGLPHRYDGGTLGLQISGEGTQSDTPEGLCKFHGR